MFDKYPGTILGYHLSMLEDSARTGALQSVINTSVKPGDTVVDLGCGTGILACFACRAGARRVYALESEPVIELARTLCRDNGFSDRIVFIHERSTRVQLPEKVDLVVTETIGNLGFDEGILGWAADACRRFLKPGGILIPKAIGLFAALVEMPEKYRDISGWSDLDYDLDFSAARSMAGNNPFWTTIPAKALLGAPEWLGGVDLLRLTGDTFEGRAELTADRAGLCHGIGAWFKADLTESIVLSNAPSDPASNWLQGFLPLERPLPVTAGDAFSLRLGAHANGSLWRWGLQRRAASTGEQEGASLQSTLAGRFLSLAQLRKGAAHYVPRLGAQGQACRFILESMDGSQCLDAIAAAAAGRFPEAFSDAKEAADMVRSLSRRFTL